MSKQFRIGIDLRCLPEDGSAGAGIAHAARYLTQALIAFSVAWEWKLYVPVGASCPVGASVHALRGSSGAALRRGLREAFCDLLFVPSGAVAPGVCTPTIPWIHDLAIFDHPEWFNQSFVRRQLTTRLFLRGIRRSIALCVVSDDTKRMLCAMVPQVSDKKCVVTHEGGDPFLDALHGVSLDEARRAARARVAATGITNAFMLMLGTVEPRKNIHFLLECWRRAKAKFSRPVDIVIAGRDGWALPIHLDRASAALNEERDGSRIHRLRMCSDDDRRDLLLAADIVALPSLHEGFGLVALEAMQAGTALCASCAGAIPEVTGTDGGVLLAAHDADVWERALTGLVNDEDSRLELARLGKARSQFFSWNKTAHIVIEVLAGAIERMRSM